jgi:hypothetical protein
MSIDINVSSIDGEIKRTYGDYNITKYALEYDDELVVKIPKNEVVKHIIIYSWERFNHIVLHYHTVNEKYRFDDKFKHVITPTFRMSSTINNMIKIRSNIFSSRVFIYLITYENYICDKTTEEKILAEYSNKATTNKYCVIEDGNSSTKYHVRGVNEILTRIQAAQEIRDRLQAAL